MTCFRGNRRRAMAVLLTIPIVPALLWMAVLVVAPTGWARARLVAEVEAATGQSVAIGSIRLGLTGHLRLGDVRLADRSSPDDPWLEAAEVRLDVHLVQMLLGCCSPKEIAVDGLDLRVHRRPDGSLEFADLFATRDGRRNAAGSGRTGGPTSINLTITNAHLVVLDDPSATRVEIVEAEGRATSAGEVAVIESLRGRANGGSIEFAARLDRSGLTPAFEAELRARRVTLGAGMEALGLLVPVVTDSVDGRLDLDLALKGQGGSLASIRSSLKGHGAIRLEPIDVSGSKILDSIDALKAIPRAARVGSVESHFAIEGARVTTDDLRIKVARLPITLVGWTDFDGRLDYAIKSADLRSALAGKLPAEAMGLLKDLHQDLGDFTTMRIVGTVAAPRLVGGPDGKPIDRARLRDSARRLGDRSIR